MTNFTPVWRTYRLVDQQNKSYVGVTGRPLRTRMLEHFQSSRLGGETPLSCAIRKYGKGSFRIEFLESSPTEQEGYRTERKWTAKLNSTDPKFGYNNTTGGIYTNYAPHYKEKLKSVHTQAKVRERHRIASKKRYENPESRKQASLVSRNLFKNPSYREQHRIRCKEVQSRPEVRLANKIFQTELKNRPEVRADTSRRAKIYHNTPSARKAHSEAQKRNFLNPHFRKKHLDGIRLYWSRRKEGLV